MRPSTSILSILAALFLSIFPAGRAAAEENLAPGADDASTTSAQRSHPYPLAVCPVSGEPLGSMDEPVVIQHEGREIRFCCEDCVDSFKKDPTTYLKQINEQITEQQKAAYPLATCVVSGEKLGAMGEPFEYVHDNRLVRFCCKSCVGQFQQEPAKYLKMIDDGVIAAQRADYPLTTCVVSGQELGSMGDPVDYVLGTQLIRLCCPDCVGELEKNPQKYLDKLKAAKQGKESEEADASMKDDG